MVIGGRAETMAELTARNLRTRNERIGARMMERQAEIERLYPNVQNKSEMQNIEDIYRLVGIIKSIYKGE
mgnify:FL=1